MRRSFLLPAAATALLAAGGWFYRSIRNEERLGAILSSTAHIIAFAAVAAPLSYIAATSGFPLQDATLEAWDRHLGIDWTEVLTFVASRPGLQNVLLVAYSSFALQTVTTVLVLGIAGQLARLSTFINAFVATTLIIIAVSAVYSGSGALAVPHYSAGEREWLPAGVVEQLAGIPGTSRRLAAYGLRTEFRGNHHVSESACRARCSVSRRPLACKRHTMDRAGPEQLVADCHAGLWKPLRR